MSNTSHTSSIHIFVCLALLYQATDVPKTAAVSGTLMSLYFVRSYKGLFVLSPGLISTLPRLTPNSL